MKRHAPIPFGTETCHSSPAPQPHVLLIYNTLVERTHFRANIPYCCADSSKVIGWYQKVSLHIQCFNCD